MGSVGSADVSLIKQFKKYQVINAERDLHLDLCLLASAASRRPATQAGTLKWDKVFIMTLMPVSLLGRFYIDIIDQFILCLIYPPLSEWVQNQPNWTLTLNFSFPSEPLCLLVKQTGMRPLPFTNWRNGYLWSGCVSCLFCSFMRGCKTQSWQTQFLLNPLSGIQTRAIFNTASVCFTQTVNSQYIRPNNSCKTAF